MKSIVLENMLTRRSVRSFTDEQITAGALDAILEAGLYAPTARQTQARQFTAIQDRKTIDALEAALKEASCKPGYDAYKGIMGSYVMGHGAPTFVIVSAANPLDAAAAVQNMALAAHAQGLASVWINQLCPVSEEPGFRAHLNGLGCNPAYPVRACLAIGHPKGEIPAAAPRVAGQIHIIR